MRIRQMVAGDREALLGIWRRSVEATHDFVSAEDLIAMTPEVDRYLASDATEFWVLEDESGDRMGFLGVSGHELESLFLAPEHLRRGGGRLLVDHARKLYGELRLDVNEQNSGAVAFYRSCGFVEVGRSDLDHQGRPYPLLHFRLAPPERSMPQ